ncbi:hypothetical protein ACLMJK_008101 [Lecanora helva]
MWNRISGKSNDAGDNSSSKGSRRNNGEHPKNSRKGSVTSSGSNKKSLPDDDDDDQRFKSTKNSSSRGDDRDRGFIPVSSSYSSTTRNLYPGTASASIATASGNHNDEAYYTPGLVRNSSLADQMPKSRSSHESEREKDGRSEGRETRNRGERERDRGGERREKREKRRKQEEDRDDEPSKSRTYLNGYGGSERVEASRGPADFPGQIGTAGFSQFPDQYDGAIPHVNADPATRPMSSHVQDQFPGQFRVQSTAPYRPPVAISEGGPGLAAEYYGDAGESVAQQPGNRTNTPSLIIGAEPHLLPASAVAAPPPEPSASGGVGAAASFFSGEFDDYDGAAGQGHQTPCTYTTVHTRPSGNNHSSAPVTPTIGGAALGSAAGYLVGNQAASHAQRPDQAHSSTAQYQSNSSSHQRPSSPTVESYHSSASRPSRPSKQSTHSSNIPIFAAGAAGLAAAAYHQNHHSSSQSSSYRPQNTTTMAQQHRHHGPLGALVDFFKDPDGVAQFEEYSEFIGVCRGCFAPGSSPRDAPRKHHYRKRRSIESLGRVDKDSRYHSSENESRRKKEQSWLTTGLAGYGFGRVGESLFKQRNDFDDTYSVKTGRRPSEAQSHRFRRRSRSSDRVETGITSDGRVYKKTSHKDSLTNPVMASHEFRHRSRSRSNSLDRKHTKTNVIVRTESGSKESGLHFQRQRSPSPRGVFIRDRQRTGDRSPENRHKPHKKKKPRKSRGFFSLSSASSSTSSIDLVERSNKNHRNKQNANRSKEDKKAEAALVGLGAAAAALALNKDRHGQKKKGVKRLVGVKESRDDSSRDDARRHSFEEEMWESAPEDDYESADSGLAYGGPRKRGSRESLSSGTDKWSWRWGNKKRRDPRSRRSASNYNDPTPMDEATEMGFTGAAVVSPNQYQRASISSNTSPPLQQVFPMPTSDPTRFDVGREGSVTSYSQPTILPIHHPQPMTPVSTTLYSDRPHQELSYQAPAYLPEDSRQRDSPHSVGVEARSQKPGPGFPLRSEVSEAPAVVSDPKPRRRDSSPARFGIDAAATSITPSRRSSAKDDISVVRFDRTEEQEENDRRERRRKRQEDREKRELEEQKQVNKERQSSKDKRRRKSESDAIKESSLERSSTNPWVSPAAAAAAAGAIGVAAGTVAARETSQSEETREQRRERRRREREQEEREDEEAAAKRRERRRKERHRESDRNEVEPAGPAMPLAISETIEPQYDVREQIHTPATSNKSVWQEAASPKRSVSYENYGDFFRPLDLSDDQVKVTSANADANVDFDQTPAIVTVEPKGFRDPEAQPVFSSADTDEIVDTSSLSFPVPKLRLVEPTPPSSRSTTPTMLPEPIVEEATEGTAKDSSPSETEWDRDQTYEQTVSSPVEDRRPVNQPVIDEIVGPNVKNKAEPLQLNENHEQDTKEDSDTQPLSVSPSYDKDVAFTAALAASAEDAGFDPSIVINDPKYRRRASPPGSAERTVPGAFDDDNDFSNISKKEKRKRDRAAKSREPIDTSRDRDDDAVVKEIISQVENPELQTENAASNGRDDDWKGSKKSKSKRSRKGRKDSSTQDDVLKNPDSSVEHKEREFSEVDGLPSEKTGFKESITTPDDREEGSKQSRKKSKRNTANLVDSGPDTSSASNVSGSNEPVSTSRSTPKASMWDRVLRRSAIDATSESNVKESINGTDADASKFSRTDSDEQKTSVDTLENGEPVIHINPKNERSGKQDASGNVTQVPGRTTHDLPIKDQERLLEEHPQANDTLYGEDNSHELEQGDVQRPESFLDMRPEPPRPPDVSPQKEEPVNLFDSSPSTPRPAPNEQIGSFGRQSQQLFEANHQEPLPTPTAVPFDFRFSKPRPSMRTARSMSQTRVVTQPSPTHTPKPKPRPKSTEFSSSSNREIRPLMLVERHSSHQAPAPEEKYPSLPSSHTTSRSSSVHDPDEDESGCYEMAETSNKIVMPADQSSSFAADPIPQADLLDSQQATPTASSFERSIEDEAPISSRDSEMPSLQHTDNDKAAGPSFKDAALGAVVGGAASFDVRSAFQGSNPSVTNLPQEEQDEFQQSLDEMAPRAGLDDAKNENFIEAKENLDVEETDTFSKESSQIEISDRHPTLEGDQINESKDADPKEGSDLPEQPFPPKLEEQVGTMRNFEKSTSGETEGIVSPSETLSVMEDDVSQKRETKNKTRSKSDGTESHQGQGTTTTTPEDAMHSDNPSSILVISEETGEAQEQDARDVRDTPFSLITSAKEDDSDGQKGPLMGSPKSTHSPQESKQAPEVSDHTTLVEGRTVEDLDRGIGSKYTPETDIGAAARSEVSDETLLQSGVAPAQVPPTNQLEKKLSNAKGKKTKKGRKAILQDPESKAPTAKGLDSPTQDLERPTVDQGTVEDTLVLPEEIIASTEQPEKIKQSETEYSPSAIPLPLDEDLELIDDPAATTESKLPSFEEGFPLREPSHKSSLQEKSEPPAQLSPQLQATEFLPENAEEHSMQSSKKVADTSEEQNPESAVGGIPAEQNETPHLSQDISETAPQQQLPLPTDQPVKVTPEEAKNADDDWAEFSRQKKGKKNKKAKKGSKIDAESWEETESPPIIAASEAPEATESKNFEESDAAAGKVIDDSIPQSSLGAAQEGPGSVDDETAFNKVKGKKNKKAKKTRDLAALGGLDTDSLPSTTLSQASKDQIAVEETSQTVPSTLQAEQEDGWTGFSSKKKAKKSKKARIEPTDADLDTKTDTPLPVLEQPQETLEDRQPRDTSHASSIDVPQGMSEVPEDEWPGFTTKKKGKKNKRAKSKMSDDVDDVIKTLTPNPGEMKLDDVEPGVTEPETKNVEGGEPDSFEQGNIPLERLEPEAEPSKIEEPQPQEPELVKHNVNKPETNSQLNKLAAEQPLAQEPAPEVRDEIFEAEEPLAQEPALAVGDEISETEQLRTQEPNLDVGDKISEIEQSKAQEPTLEARDEGFEAEQLKAPEPKVEVGGTSYGAEQTGLEKSIVEEPEVGELKHGHRAQDPGKVTPPDLIEPTVAEVRGFEPESNEAGLGERMSKAISHKQEDINQKGTEDSLQRTTRTPEQDVPPMFKAEKTQPPLNNPNAEEFLADGHERTKVEQPASQNLSGSEQTLREIETYDYDPSRASEAAEEMDLIDQYGQIDEQREGTADRDDTADSLAREGATEELELVDQYGKEDSTYSPLHASAVTGLAADNNQNFIEEQQVPRILGHEVEVNTLPSVKEEVIHNELPESTELIENVENGDDDTLTSRVENHSLDRNEPSNNGPIDSSLYSSKLGDQLLPEHRGDDADEARSMVGQTVATDPVQVSPVDTAYTRVHKDPEPGIEDETSRDVVFTPSLESSQMGSAEESRDPGTVAGHGVEDRDVGVKEETLITGASEELKPQHAYDETSVESSISPQRPENTVQMREIDSAVEEQQQPIKSKKDKKRAKKAKSLAWEAEESPSSMSREQFVQEAPNLESEGRTSTSLPGPNLVAEQPAMFEPRAKSKKERKKAKRAQSSSFENTIDSDSNLRQLPDWELEKLEREDQDHVEKSAKSEGKNEYASVDDQTSSLDPQERAPVQADECLATPSKEQNAEQTALALEQSQDRVNEMEPNANNVTQADEDATYSYKKSKKGKKKEKKKSRQATLTPSEPRDELQQAIDDSGAHQLRDEPTKVYINDDQSNEPRQEHSSEEVKPIEIIEPESNLSTVNQNVEGHETVPTLTPRDDSGQPVKTVEGEFAAIENDRKGKRSSSEDVYASEAVTDAPPARSASDTVPIIANQQHRQTEPEDRTETFPDSVEEPSSRQEASSILKRMGEDLMEPIPMQESKEIRTQLAEEVPTAHADPEALRSGYSEPLEAPEDPETRSDIPSHIGLDSADRHDVDSKAGTPGVELLDPSAQRHYDIQYAQELERQGVDSPRSSRVELPVLATESESTSASEEISEDPQHEDLSQRPGPKGPHDFAADQFAQDPVPSVDDPSTDERRLDYAESLEEPTGVSPSPITDLAALVSDRKSLDDRDSSGFDKEYTQASFEPDEGQPSDQLFEDLATPAAEIEMLDAQKQQEYNEEYAKELERQLSPPREEQAAAPIDEVQPSIDSIAGFPAEQRIPLAKPPPLEDIIEESRSRSGSVQENPEHGAASSPFQVPKKSKKGKKGKKQQQPIIWEDETATPPVESGIDRIEDVSTKSTADPTTLEGGDSQLPIDLEEPIKPPSKDEASIIEPTAVEKTQSLDEGKDYFTIQPSRLAEEDVGRDPESEDFQRLPPSEPTYSNEGKSIQHGSEPSIETSLYDPPTVTGEQGVAVGSTDYSYQPGSASQPADQLYRAESFPTPANEQPSEESSYKTAKKGKKAKKSKKREPEKGSEVSSLEPQQTTLPRALPTSPIKDDASENPNSATEQGPDHEAQPTRREEDSPTKGSGSEDPKGVPAAAGLGLAALAADSLSRRDSKKGGKKGKKGKKAKWQDLEGETPSSESPLQKDENVMESTNKSPLQEDTTVTAEQEHRSSFPEPATSPTISEHRLSDSESRRYHPQSDESTYRDSAINVSESPVIPDELSIHRPVRDSGYPETESSPTFGTSGAYGETPERKSQERLSVDENEPQSVENDQHYPQLERSRSATEDQTELSKGMDPSPATPISSPKGQQRRSRSYDSDDSADSGYDAQRRRRRQAMKREAREPSPVSSTTKDRSSALFNSSPSTRETRVDRPHAQQSSTDADPIRQEPTWSFSREGSPHPKTHDATDEADVSHTPQSVSDALTYSKLTGHQEEPPQSIFGGPVHHDEDTTAESKSPPTSDTRGRSRRLRTISEDSQERVPLHGKDKRSISDVGSREAGVKERRVQSPPTTARLLSDITSQDPVPHVPGPPKHDAWSSDLERSRSPAAMLDPSQQYDPSRLPSIPPKHRDGEYRTASAASMRSDNSIHAIIRTPSQVRSASGQSFRSSGTPPLRRVDRSASGDLRGASKLSQAKARAKTSESEADSDVNIPSSSTYDPVTDKGKNRADMADVYEGWGDVRGQSPMSPTRPPSMRKRQSMQLLDLETRLDQLVSENRLLQSQKSTAERNLQDQTRDHSQQRHAYEEALQEHKVYLAQKDSELNELRGIVEEWQGKVDQLTEVNEALTSSRALNEEHEQRYRGLEDEHAHLKERHTDLTAGMEALVQREVATHLEAKNAELQQLRVELESAKQQVRSLQQQLVSSRESDDFVERDEDYFENQCQSLCQHVQQWVLRFSKFSDMKACYRASEIRDETKVDRMENAILDGTDVDIYLQDRVKRRDVFMAVVMTMIFDYIFTRYLFGMDREQRQKLKNLEKTLQDIGPMSAVCKWRATTLTLLMKRDDFARQRATDTEAIVHEIYDTLAVFLPPPSHLIAQIQDSLRKVINVAADLSIEMRTQRADYQMLPPLQPDYDTNGDLAQKVYFNALTMNERSGATTSNQVLQEQGAVVRMVLFPLVVKNEEDDEQIIVCPAQVLTANSKGKKTVRVMSVQGSTQGGRSEVSFPDVSMEGGMI